MSSETLSSHPHFTPSQMALSRHDDCFGNWRLSQHKCVAIRKSLLPSNIRPKLVIEPERVFHQHCAPLERGHLDVRILLTYRSSGSKNGLRLESNVTWRYRVELIDRLITSPALENTQFPAAWSIAGDHLCIDLSLRNRHRIQFDSSQQV